MVHEDHMAYVLALPMNEESNYRNKRPQDLFGRQLFQYERRKTDMCSRI